MASSSAATTLFTDPKANAQQQAALLFEGAPQRGTPEQEQWCPNRCPVASVHDLLERAGLRWPTDYNTTLPYDTCDLCAHRWLFVVSPGGRTVPVVHTSSLSAVAAHRRLRCHIAQVTGLLLDGHAHETASTAPQGGRGHAASLP